MPRPSIRPLAARLQFACSVRAEERELQARRAGVDDEDEAAAHSRLDAPVPPRRAGSPGMQMLNFQPVTGGSQCRRRGVRSGAGLRVPDEDLVDDREEEARRPAAHQDAGQRLDAADQPPPCRQDEVAVAGRGVGHRAEIERRVEVRHRAAAGEVYGPHRDLDEVDQDGQAGHLDEQPQPPPGAASERGERALQPAHGGRQTRRVEDHARRHQGECDQQLREHGQAPRFAPVRAPRASGR